MSNTRRKYKLLSGKHHRRQKDGTLQRICAGEPFEPTDRERRQNDDRIVRSRSVFVMPSKRFGET